MSIKIKLESEIIGDVLNKPRAVVRSNEMNFFFLKKNAK